VVKNVKDIKGQPRSHAELGFALSLIPCPDCSATGPVQTESGGDLTFQPIYWWTCPGCGAERAYRFRIWPVLPYDGPPTAHLGGDEPSRIIPADSFAAEVGRLVPLLHHEPETLAPDDWHPAWATLIRLRTCLNELAKFDGRGLTDERERADALHARFTADAPRNTARYNAMYPPRPQPRGALDRFIANGHGAWVRRGCTGPGRIDIAHVNALNLYLGAQNLRLSRFEAVTFEGANAGYSTFTDAVWLRVYARGARLHSCTWEGTTFEECDLRGSDMMLNKLSRAVVMGGDWDRVKMDRAILTNAWFESVSLRDTRLIDTRLDNAIFIECDFRGADFSMGHDRVGLTTNKSTRFVRCDLRETTWTDRRDLDQVEFVDCLEV
jgi:hypothetical protein